MLDEEGGAFMPSMRREIPFQRNAGMTLRDTGIYIGRHQPLEFIGRTVEQPVRCRHDIFLREGIGWHGGSQAAQPRRHGQRTRLTERFSLDGGAGRRELQKKTPRWRAANRTFTNWHASRLRAMS